MRSSRRLRQHLAHAKDYDAALANARQLVANHEPGTTAWETRFLPELFACVFPDERAFYTLALKQNRARDWTHTLLIGAVATAAELTELWPKSNGNAWALSFVRKLGAKALPLLTGHEWPSAGLLHALAVFPEPEAAAAMMRHLKKPKPELVAVATSYFQDYPELAVAAYEALPKDMPPSGRKAAERMLTLKPKKAVARTRAARSDAFIDANGPKATSLGIVPLHERRIRISGAAHAVTWDSEKDGRKAFDLDEDGMVRESAIVDPGPVDEMVVWRTPEGLALVEHHPKKGLDAAGREKAREALGAYVVQVAVPKDAKKIGSITVEKKKARILAQRGKVPNGAIVPLDAGRYDVFVEKLGGSGALSTAIGKLERRIRIVRSR